jgi:glycosyltransferase involved in cell wall biosynthesis/peptidoglycan/xylan/chitin deacetylase (PgdA/CDA1 family)
MRGALRERGWHLRLGGGNVARVVFPADDADGIRVEIGEIRSSEPWDVQLNQPELRVEQGVEYRVSFRARAPYARSLRVGFSRARPPWDNLGLYQTVELDAAWREHEVAFLALASETNARLHFDVGGSPLPVELSAVAVRRPSGEAVEPDLVLWGGYPDGRRNPVRSAERNPGGARFSVVIPTYQRRAVVLESVQALAQQDLDEPFEVIVVVDGSRDGSAEALRGLELPFALTVIEQPNAGAASARNRGAQLAGGEILLFLDDDMVAHPRLLAEHASSLAEGADVVLGHLPLHPAARSNPLAGGVVSWLEERARRLSRPGASPGCHDVLTGQMSVRREVFEKLGGFDTRFTSGGSYGYEDVDFGRRVLDAGYRVTFNVYALSYQNYVVSPRQYLSQARQAGRAAVAFGRKHPDDTLSVLAPALANARDSSLPRAVATTWPLSVPFVAPFRALALALLESGIDRGAPLRFFERIGQLEYWRGVREAGGRWPSGGVRILVYHSIRDLSGEPLLEPYGIPPQVFRDQLRALRRVGFQFISAEQLLGFLQGRSRLPRAAVLITFDDCYEDLRESALPVLHEMRAPALAFAVSARLGGSNQWDVANGAPPLRLLDPAGLAALTRSGVEIGAHSRTHTRLTEASQRELEDEVTGSVHELEAAGLGRPRFFAYPYGDCDDVVRGAVRRAGVEVAFTVARGKAARGQDRFAIPRIEILREDTGLRFLRKVIFAG